MTLWKNLENTGIRGQQITMVGILFTLQGAKSQYKWYLLRLIRNIRDGCCSRIKSNNYVNGFFQSNKPFSVAFDNDTCGIKMKENLNTFADTINN